MMSVYNGGQFLAETLHGIISRIKDINVIHIHDGSWENSGYDAINSTDDTEKIIEDINVQYGEDIQIIYEKSDHIWHNPSEKRNHQLKLISETFEEPYTILWLDDDEEIRFRTGIEEIWIRELCAELQRPAIIDTYAYNASDQLLTARLIPSGKGIHWHSERAMCLHDMDCHVIIDWTPKQFILIGEIVRCDDFYIVNKWNCRDTETLHKRKQYNLHEVAEHDKMIPCAIRRT